jgi:hypothetical protein
MGDVIHLAGMCGIEVPPSFALDADPSLSNVVWGYT